jgi:hypothetical protein
MTPANRAILRKWCAVNWDKRSLGEIGYRSVSGVLTEG